MKRLFEKAFTPPFKVDNLGGFVYDSNHNFAFQFAYEMPEERGQFIVDVINGDKVTDLDGKVEHDSGYILANGQQVLLIRGWGYLTGIGGLHLDEVLAVQIQDDLADYIVEKLNGL